MRLTSTLGLVVLAAGLAACGSTVPVASRGTDGGTYDDLTTGGVAPVLPRTQDPVAGPGAVTSTTGTTGTTVSSGSDPTVASPGPLGADRSPVEVGFFVSKDVGKALSTFGLNGLSSGDGAGQVAGAVALVNGLGGLNGRPVTPVAHLAEAGGDEDQEGQAACDLFFVDHHVKAVVSVLPIKVLAECARRQNVPMSVSSISTMAAAQLQRFPQVVLPNQIERDHGVQVLIPALNRLGYFRPQGVAPVKIGLLTNEAEGFEKVPAQVAAELRKVGQVLTDTVTLSTLDKGAQEASSGVLRFQAERITHVVVVDDHGGPLTFFSLAAQPQGYYPKLGLSSYEIPQIAADVLPASQFKDAVGVGWLPTFDVGITMADKTLNSPAKQCIAQMTRAGEDMTNSGSRGIALGVCDSLLALRAAWTGRALELPAFLRGLAGLGRSYLSTLTFSTDFASHRDGAATARPLSYDASCTCFYYSGPAFRL
jgi:hypothetical protein